MFPVALVGTPYRIPIDFVRNSTRVVLQALHFESFEYCEQR